MTVTEKQKYEFTFDALLNLIRFYRGMLCKAHNEIERLTKALDAAKPDEWRPDRPGWYWGYWPSAGLDGSPCRYLGLFNGLELWEGGGRPEIVGCLVVAPPTPREGDGK